MSRVFRFILFSGSLLSVCGVAAAQNLIEYAQPYYISGSEIRIYSADDKLLLYAGDGGIGHVASVIGAATNGSIGSAQGSGHAYRLGNTFVASGHGGSSKLGNAEPRGFGNAYYEFKVTQRCQYRLSLTRMEKSNPSGNEYDDSVARLLVILNSGQSYSINEPGTGVLDPGVRYRVDGGATAENGGFASFYAGIVITPLGGVFGGAEETALPPDRVTKVVGVPVYHFVGAASGHWYDPPLTEGYRYRMASNALFTAITFPTNFPGTYTVLVSNSVIGAFSPGDTASFTNQPGGGVAGFVVTNSIAISNVTVFPLRMEFNTSHADFSVEPLFPPVTADAQDLITLEDVPLPITLTGTNDSGTEVFFYLITSPTNGVLSGVTPQFTYTPATNSSGEDHFTFEATDGFGVSTTAVIRINVQTVNDAPESRSRTAVVVKNVPREIRVHGYDVESPFGFEISSPPTNGVLTGTGPTFHYAPQSNFVGADSFGYRTFDDTTNSGPATVTISVLEDTDDDGLPDLWEDANSLNKGDAADGAADPDGDGASNRLEFWTGTQPTNAASRLALETSLLPQSLAFTGLAGYGYALQVSTNLSTWQTLSNFSPATNQWTSVPLEAAAPIQLYRILQTDRP